MNGSKYIALDCNGTPLQFTGSGRSVQCEETQADVFDSREQAQAALTYAEEVGGVVTCVESVN